MLSWINWYRKEQPEIEANLELDDIFEIVANRSEGTKQ